MKKPFILRWNDDQTPLGVIVVRLCKLCLNMGGDKVDVLHHLRRVLEDKVVDALMGIPSNRSLLIEGRKERIVDMALIGLLQSDQPPFNVKAGDDVGKVGVALVHT
jgi:hypothetical protein